MKPQFFAIILGIAGWLTAPAIAQNADNYPSDTGSAAHSGSVIPSGTQISVRTNEAIDSSSASEGQQFSAEVADDVKGSSGVVLIQKGSPAELTISKMSSG